MILLMFALYLWASEGPFTSSEVLVTFIAGPLSCGCSTSTCDGWHWLCSMAWWAGLFFSLTNICSVCHKQISVSRRVLFSSFIIGTSVQRSSRSAFERSTGNDLVATINVTMFFCFFLSFVFFSPSSTFRIEGVLGSKNLFSESCLECPKT